MIVAMVMMRHRVQYFLCLVSILTFGDHSMPELPDVLLIANLVSTWYMVGLIWFVQIVHYPLFAGVGRDTFVEYQKRHQLWTTVVVGPAMLVEAFSTILLAWYTPVGVAMWQVISGIGLILIIWISTAVLQVPCHGRLGAGFDRHVHARLVGSNWIRTIAWTGRGMLVAWMLADVLSGS